MLVGRIYQFFKLFIQKLKEYIYDECPTLKRRLLPFTEMQSQAVPQTRAGIRPQPALQPQPALLFQPALLPTHHPSQRRR